ncbi:Hypothetical predicted protein [Olea europaea subsp. europaea]|uniref:Uncharacterized protein n=1 Tax=Olea europaea subsp. europaea TaxID=158383 RepID=A0A8S0QJH3_OLEEU|nr:Hypothetical predicted protein [Olea europaea subsp. europaea]
MKYLQSFYIPRHSTNSETNKMHINKHTKGGKNAKSDEYYEAQTKPAAINERLAASTSPRVPEYRTLNPREKRRISRKRLKKKEAAKRNDMGSAKLLLALWDICPKVPKS